MRLLPASVLTGWICLLLCGLAAGQVAAELATRPELEPETASFVGRPPAGAAAAVHAAGGPSSDPATLRPFDPALWVPVADQSLGSSGRLRSSALSCLHSRAPPTLA
jgi:hypothetical protein